MRLLVHFNLNVLAAAEPRLELQRTETQDTVATPAVSDSTSRTVKHRSAQFDDEDLQLDVRQTDDDVTAATDLSFPPETPDSAGPTIARSSGRTRTGFTRRAKSRKDTPVGYGRLYYKTCMTLQLMCSCATTRVRNLLG